MTVLAVVAVVVIVIGSAGFTLAVNGLASWIFVIAAVAAVVTGWSEGRHIAAVKREISTLSLLPRPRRAADDNPQFFSQQ
ncbi:MAG TPA: hypothetical protein VE172_14230 [Stackebrandtia sp.]|jgi:UDP-N-acetylmuramyl pentapeptide phosphotransferase/UDP-N-acetylglucosamine-1-phosphate transferase|uniref:hypothetical protein n=1 Tax=Stackebrandtia sp. TaxID=2023065 RepID=UPI002D686742|nr:hypothetical protein [Stackebrandtia sp.]HZE39960.1 hypothetical protein [Stackebrandtia sp.]